VRLAVLTPRLPGRDHYFAQCRESVLSELQPLDFHLTLDPEENDTSTAGEAMNILYRRAIKLGATHVLQVSDDDYLLPGWYSGLVVPFTYGGIEMTQCDVTAVDAEGRVLKVWESPEYSPAGIFQRVCSFFVLDIGVWQRAGGYAEVPFGSDWLMLARATAVRPVRHKKVTGAYYCHRQWGSTETARETPEMHSDLRASLAGLELVARRRGIV
jgi:hypothetical protein